MVASLSISRDLAPPVQMSVKTLSNSGLTSSIRSTGTFLKAADTADSQLEFWLNPTDVAKGLATLMKVFFKGERSV